mmetsp:Transcript_25391/g.70671  ORF Transcript_25391/g.70671 Transcript_25391/m.70671 type:complete len:212 (+) Transcript_25391:1693-2328(+)
MRSESLQSVKWHMDHASRALKDAILAEVSVIAHMRSRPGEDDEFARKDATPFGDKPFLCEVLPMIVPCDGRAAIPSWRRKEVLPAMRDAGNELLVEILCVRGHVAHLLFVVQRDQADAHLANTRIAAKPRDTAEFFPKPCGTLLHASIDSSVQSDEELPLSIAKTRDGRIAVNEQLIERGFHRHHLPTFLRGHPLFGIASEFLAGHATRAA